MHYGVFIYPGVEPVDLATFGVLSMARRVVPSITITTIAPQAGIVTLSNGLRVVADHGIDDVPAPDVLIVTGGPGWAAQTEVAPVLAWLRSLPASTIVASACTGAMILAAAGLLDGHRATTKREVVAGAEEPPIEVLARRHRTVDTMSALVVDEGRVVTGGGVTLCIDLTLHLIGRLHGTDAAAEVARITEYGAAGAANRARLAVVES